MTIGTEATPSDPSGASTGTVNVTGSDASQAFDTAINGAGYLEGNGGTVVVLPGVYEFENPVTVPAGVRIEGSRGAILRPAPQTTEPTGESVGIFDVQGDGFVLKALSIEMPYDPVTNVGGDYVDGQAAIFIGPGVKDVIIASCVFVVKHGNDADEVHYRDHSFIRAGDLSGEPFVNLTLSANSFQLSPFPNENVNDEFFQPLPFLPVEAQAQAWIRRCVLVTDVRSVIVDSNTFAKLGRFGPGNTQEEQQAGMVEYLVRIQWQNQLIADAPEADEEAGIAIVLGEGTSKHFIMHNFTVASGVPGRQGGPPSRRPWSGARGTSSTRTAIRTPEDPASTSATGSRSHSRLFEGS